VNEPQKANNNLKSELNLEELLAVALKAAHVGAEIIVDYRKQSTLTFDTKGDINNFVTEADLASERAVRDAIRSNRPNDTITGEEYEADDRQGAQVRWSIDPLDGTINYMRRLPFYACSVGAQDITTGEWVVGAVVAPELNTVWYAAKGQGSFVERDGQTTKLTGPPADRKSRIMATGFSYSPDIRPSQLAEVTKLMVGFQDLRRNGAAAIDMCHVAEGVLDAYFERDIKEYDWAAAALIAEEAGVPVIRPQVVGDATVVGVLAGFTA
jgi:myo-inositol-1(or 4)-monophosphatase